MNIKIFICAILSITSGVLYADTMSDLFQLATGNQTQKSIILGVREEKQQQKETLQKRLAELQHDTISFRERIASEQNKIRDARRMINDEFRADLEDEADARELAALNESLQVLTDIERPREQLIKTIELFIALIDKYLEDPNYEQFKKEHKLTDTAYYTFDDLLRIHEIMREFEHRPQQISEQTKNTQTELKAREKTIATVNQELKKRQEELASIDSETDPVLVEAIRAEEKLYELRKEYVQFQIEEGMLRTEYNALQLYITKAQNSLLKEYFSRIKASLRISESDVVDAKESLKTVQQEYFVKQEQLRLHMDEIQQQYKMQETALEGARKQFSIKPGADLDDWSREPKQTVLSYIGQCKVALMNLLLTYMRVNRELLEAQSMLEKEQFNYQSLQARTKETYYKIYTRRFVTEDQTTKEVREYEALRATALASLVTYKEKMAIATEQLNAQKKIADNIEKLRLDLQSKQYTLFKNSPQEYAQTFEFVRRAERKIRETTELLGKLTGIYSGIIAEVSAIQRITAFIAGELQSIITIWYRPSYAISLRGIQKAFSDLGIFLHEMWTYMSRFNPYTFLGRMQDAFKISGVFAGLVSKLLTILICLIFLILLGNTFIVILLDIGQSTKGFIRFVGYLGAFCIQRMRAHAISLTLWSACYALMSSYAVPDPYLYALFMLLSIPYWLYFTQRTAHYMGIFNAQHGYPFLTPGIQDRFLLVLSLFCYATIPLVFLRSAFLQINYYQPDLYRSELPSIIVALNFIVLQISLMLLITKEQLLAFIPQRNSFMSWLYKQVDTYYYLIFCGALAIIVMSHPYVGYGRLVLYVIGGIIYSLVLFKILLYLHGLFRRATKFLFFEEQDDVVRERFDGAKSWFGLSIIGSFLFFLFVGVLIAARIWNLPITFKSALDWFREPLLLKASANPITAFSLMTILLFIISGVLISYALNRFVLERIFDLLLVDTGVQNMVTRLLRYIIVAITVMVAFHSVGLGGLVTWFIAALGLSIGWVLKDPIADIVAYFIILVQRPVKIGDYIKLNEEAMGVVRKITPRSVVLRRKNSISIVIPNSKLITQAVENWNYTRNFIAFDDILVAINFKEDPALVKNLLTQAVSEHPQVLRNPSPIIRLDNFDARGYMFMVRGYLSSAYTLDQWDIASDVRILIVQKMRAHNIEFAVPIVQVDKMKVEDPRL
jgi:small-conductance mechanosensitive channel